MKDQVTRERLVDLIAHFEGHNTDAATAILELLSAREDTERLKRHVEIVTSELRAHQFKNESLVSLVVAFSLAVPPAPVEHEGKTYRFVPPDPHLYLEQLRRAIEAARDNEQVKQDARLKAAIGAQRAEEKP